MDLNEIKIKLTGTANAMKPLEIGKDYDLTISNAECRSGGEQISNDDGTYNEVYKLYISELSDINIISEKEIIKAKKKKGSMSQKLRYAIQQYWEEGSDMEFEDFYNNEMSNLIREYSNK